MAKSFHELSPRAQIDRLRVLVCAAGRAAPGRSARSAAHRRSRRPRTAGEARRPSSSARRRSPPGCRRSQREVRALEAALRETTAVIPEEKDPQDVLRNLHELASESLLDIASFKPKNVVTKTQYTEWPIELGLEGSYHDLGRFFDRIAAMSRLMSVSDLKIKTQVKPNGRGSVAVSCVATTFVFEKDVGACRCREDGHEDAHSGLALVTALAVATPASARFRSARGSVGRPVGLQRRRPPRSVRHAHPAETARARAGPGASGRPACRRSPWLTSPCVAS